MLAAVKFCYAWVMRVILQRVLSASVRIDGVAVGTIDEGYVLFVGVMEGDQESHAEWLAEKISKLRLFDSPEGKINDQSIVDRKGSALVVSQFTLAGKTEKGNRPDYTAAMEPKRAAELYETFIAQLRQEGIVHVETGRFGANMKVQLTNDGPVTLLLER